MTEEKKDEEKNWTEGAKGVPDDAPEVEAEGDAEGDGNGKDAAVTRRSKLHAKISAILDCEEFAAVFLPDGTALLVTGSRIALNPVSVLSASAALSIFSEQLTAGSRNALQAAAEAQKEPKGKGKLKLIVPGGD
jgi:hypothetical protein